MAVIVRYNDIFFLLNMCMLYIKDERITQHNSQNLHSLQNRYSCLLSTFRMVTFWDS